MEPAAELPEVMQPGCENVWSVTSDVEICNGVAAKYRADITNELHCLKKSLSKEACSVSSMVVEAL
jgi:hypothetical protein